VSIARRMREASGASRRVADGGLERSTANFAARLRHSLDPRNTSSAHALLLPGPGGERSSARGASWWIEKVEYRRKVLRELLGERGHI
jgi:hypothetical protein